MSISRSARNTHPKILCANLGPRSEPPIPTPSARAQPALRTGRPKIRSANLGPHFASPIPAPSARPLTKGAFLEKGRRVEAGEA